MNTLARMYAEKAEQDVYAMLCGITKKTGWSLKSTSGKIGKKNFVRAISIGDTEFGWMNIRYTGLNVEAFNTISVGAENFSMSVRVKKDSTMHTFMVDFFNDFCHNGGVMCS